VTIKKLGNIKKPDLFNEITKIQKEEKVKIQKYKIN